jgi:hypothetical protein
MIDLKNYSSLNYDLTSSMDAMGRGGIIVSKGLKYALSLKNNSL